jgi:hypothetical protein
MGDRAVFGFKATKESQPIWLYSHWGGSSQTSDLAKAIVAAAPRWNDPHYATRIAISQIVGDDWSGELGYGISAGDDQFSHPDYDTIPVVIWSERVVVLWEYESDEQMMRSFDIEFSHYVDMAVRG